MAVRQMSLFRNYSLAQIILLPMKQIQTFTVLLIGMVTEIMVNLATNLSKCGIRVMRRKMFQVGCFNNQW